MEPRTFLAQKHKLIFRLKKIFPNIYQIVSFHLCYVNMSLFMIDQRLFRSITYSECCAHLRLLHIEKMNVLNYLREGIFFYL